MEGLGKNLTDKRDKEKIASYVVEPAFRLKQRLTESAIRELGEDTLEIIPMFANRASFWIPDSEYRLRWSQDSTHPHSPTIDEL